MDDERADVEKPHIGLTKWAAANRKKRCEYCKELSEKVGNAELLSLHYGIGRNQRFFREQY